ncbi:nuclease [Prochlorococcus sp. MIT 0916]|uniref:nuclease n=1 Tax=Prochlorococcus sp. MIT 0916 TaxID=3082521 RepID=UPI0039B373F0
MNKIFTKILILLISFFCFYPELFAAEILQVTSSNILLIGDHNRTYTVKLACIEISPDLEENSLMWLKTQLPRHTKVNLKPKGSVDGILVAKVIPIDSNIDLNEKYINEGLAKNKC